MEDGYSYCSNRWALDNDIKNEIRLLLIISSLCAKDGICFASNNYFSELFDETEETISRKLAKLLNKGYIKIDYERRGTEIISRNIRLTEISTDRYQKNQPTVDKNVKGNNTSINNISINKKEIYKERFKKPTLEEVENYIKDKKMDVNAKTFFDYFTTSNWTDSKGNKVKNWKQKLITWNSYNKKKEVSTPSWFEESQTFEEISEEEFDALLK